MEDFIARHNYSALEMKSKDGRDYALVGFNTYDEARNMIRDLDNTDCHGKKVHVRMADDGKSFLFSTELYVTQVSVARHCKLGSNIQGVKPIDHIVPSSNSQLENCKVYWLKPSRAICMAWCQSFICLTVHHLAFFLFT